MNQTPGSVGTGESEARVSTGNGGLDAMLGGGLERGTNALLMGTAGVGKSTMRSHPLRTGARV